MTIKDTMVDILSLLFRIPADGKPITILDLSAVPSDILNVVISLVCRLTFDFALWAERDVPMLLVCEIKGQPIRRLICACGTASTRFRRTGASNSCSKKD